VKSELLQDMPETRSSPPPDKETEQIHVKKFLEHREYMLIGQIIMLMNG
jgi:hypothetical protein